MPPAQAPRGLALVCGALGAMGGGRPGTSTMGPVSACVKGPWPWKIEAMRKSYRWRKRQARPAWRRPPGATGAGGAAPMAVGMAVRPSGRRASPRSCNGARHRRCWRWKVPVVCVAEASNEPGARRNGSVTLSKLPPPRGGGAQTGH